MSPSSALTRAGRHEFRQRDVAAAAHQSFAGRYDDFERLARVFESSGIRQRYAVRPLDWYLEPLGWPERTAAYLEGACQLFVDAATQALDAAGLRAAEVDTIVTVSSTGIATPSLEARVAGRLGFRPDVERVPVFGLGCAGGVSGFSIASRLARRAQALVLVAVELCTLAFRLDKLDQGEHRRHGALRRWRRGLRARAGEAGIAAVEMSGQHTWPDTLDIMGWDVDPQGFGVIFDRAIPPFAQAHIAPAIAGILEPGGTGPRRRRSLRLPPGRRQGHRRRWNARCRSSKALSITSAPCSRTTATCRRRRRSSCSSASFRRAAVAHAADRDGAGFHRELRFPEESRVTPAALLLALVTVERLAELWLARRNTAALLAKGAVEVAAGHYPADRAAARALARRTVDLRLGAPDQPTVACGLSGASGSAGLGAADAWPSLDDADHRPAGRAAGVDRPLPVSSRIRTISSSSARSRSCRFASACLGLLWSSRWRTRSS